MMATAPSPRASRSLRRRLSSRWGQAVSSPPQWSMARHGTRARRSASASVPLPGARLVPPRASAADRNCSRRTSPAQSRTRGAPTATAGLCIGRRSVRQSPPGCATAPTTVRGPRGTGSRSQQRPSAMRPSPPACVLSADRDRSCWPCASPTRPTPTACASAAGRRWQSSGCAPVGRRCWPKPHCHRASAARRASPRPL